MLNSRYIQHLAVMAATGRGVGNYELDIIHSPALECPFAVMSNDIGLPLFFCTELMPL